MYTWLGLNTRQQHVTRLLVEMNGAPGSGPQHERDEEVREEHTVVTAVETGHPMFCLSVKPARAPRSCQTRRVLVRSVGCTRLTNVHTGHTMLDEIEN